VSVAGGFRRGGALFERQRHASTAAIVAFLIGTTGGGSALVAYLATAQLRAWNRLSLFIAFFALFAVGLGLDALRRRLQMRSRGALLAGLALAVVLVAGVLDQTSPRFAPDYKVARARYGNDDRFVKRIERTLPANSMVFQLPYIAFPESPPRFGMIDYDQARGYIHSSTLRWSFGGVKGRSQTDWQDRLTGRQPAAVIEGIAAVGFRGLWIDRFGYPDRGKALEKAVQKVVGPPAFQSDDRRLVFYDLRPYSSRLAAKAGPAGIAKLRFDTLAGPTPPGG
jgi:phosphoglycerol transferase